MHILILFEMLHNCHTCKKLCWFALRATGYCNASTATHKLVGVNINKNNTLYVDWCRLIPPKPRGFLQTVELLKHARRSIPTKDSDCSRCFALILVSCLHHNMIPLDSLSSFCFMYVTTQCNSLQVLHHDVQCDLHGQILLLHQNPVLPQPASISSESTVTPWSITQLLCCPLHSSGQASLMHMTWMGTTNSTDGGLCSQSMYAFLVRCQRDRSNGKTG